VTPWVLQGVDAVILRYGVDRFTPNCAAISCTGTSLERSRVRIVFSSLGLSFFGRPPLRPRARAAFLAGVRALADQIALELSERAKDMDHQLPGWGSRVDLLGERGEPDAARLSTRGSGE
jgi:hypothetical protein